VCYVQEGVDCLEMVRQWIATTLDSEELITLLVLSSFLLIAMTLVVIV